MNASKQPNHTDWIRKIQLIHLNKFMQFKSAVHTQSVFQFFLYISSAFSTDFNVHWCVLNLFDMKIVTAKPAKLTKHTPFQCHLNELQWKHLLVVRLALFLYGKKERKTSTKHILWAAKCSPFSVLRLTFGDFIF